MTTTTHVIEPLTPDGALDLIAQAGGGEVVSFPNELTPGKRTSSSFLHNGTRAMFEQAGFTFERHIGKSKTVMRKTIVPAHDRRTGGTP